MFMVKCVEERPLIGYDDSEKLVYEPGRFYVKVTRRFKYGTPSNCGQEPGVVQAPMPETLLPRCLADDTLLAHIALIKLSSFPEPLLFSFNQKSTIENQKFETP
jgi:transposase